MSKHALSAAVKSGAADAATLIRRHLSPAVASSSVSASLLTHSATLHFLDLHLFIEGVVIYANDPPQETYKLVGFPHLLAVANRNSLLSGQVEATYTVRMARSIWTWQQARTMTSENLLALSASFLIFYTLL